MAGCVQLLGLDRVKERLGRKWPEFADRVLLIAQQVLDQHLGPGDIYRSIDDASFQICFESADETWAKALVATISADIEGRILSDLESAKGELSVRSFAAARFPLKI